MTRGRRRSHGILHRLATGSIGRADPAQATQRVLRGVGVRKRGSIKRSIGGWLPALGVTRPRRSRRRKR